MELLFYGVVAAGGIFLYNSFQNSRFPKPDAGHPSGNALPAPRFLYSEPRLWTSAPVDISGRPYNTFYGTNNDPRRAYLLYGGTRIVTSGYNPVAKTNLQWPQNSSNPPSSGSPLYSVHPVSGTGESQILTTGTVYE